jgi:glycosyltransferase involved in cell wall biosynthesis
VLIINNVANVSKILFDKLKEINNNIEFIQPITSVQSTNKLYILFSRLTFIFILYKKAKKHKLFHIHYAFFGIYGILLNKEYILHCHGTDLRNNMFNKYKLLTYLSLKYAKVILYATPDLKQYIPDEFKSKSYFLPNPILTDTFKPILSNITNKKEVFFISKMDKTKGIEKFQKIIDYLESNDKISKITLFNYGNEKIDYMFYGTKIDYLNKILYSEMPKIISNYDIIIGQLELGAIGMSELEALSSGKCVVSYFKYEKFYPTSIPIINSNNVDYIIKELDKCLNNYSLIEDYGSMGRKWIVNNHNVDNITSKFIDILKINKLSLS